MFREHRAMVYARLVHLMGYRFRGDLPAATAVLLLAETMGALMTGLVLDSGTTDADPGTATATETTASTFTTCGFGSTEEAEWTTASYALTGTLLAWMEPDPTSHPDADTILDFLSSRA